MGHAFHFRCCSNRACAGDLDSGLCPSNQQCRSESIAERKLQQVRVARAGARLYGQRSRRQSRGREKLRPALHAGEAALSAAQAAGLTGMSRSHRARTPRWSLMKRHSPRIQAQALDQPHGLPPCRHSQTLAESRCSSLACKIRDSAPTAVSSRSPPQLSIVTSFLWSNNSIQNGMVSLCKSGKGSTRRTSYTPYRAREAVRWPSTNLFAISSQT